MLVMPAIDVREGACVQLVGGSYAAERVREPDPLRAAKRWRDAGFTRLHVVDLDAALGVGHNDDVVAALQQVRGVDVQVGGGLRSAESLQRVLDAGAAAAVVGTRALEEPGWIAEAARRWPFRLVAAVDVRDGAVVVRGWTRAAPLGLEEALDALDALPLAALLVTCVEVEGRMQGPDLATLKRVRARTSLPLVASGGITTLDDLRALRAMGMWGAVVGMALYTGTLDPRTTAKEFGR